MHVPSGRSGVHAVPKTPHSYGFARPRRTSPQRQAFGSAIRAPGTSKRCLGVPGGELVGRAAGRCAGSARVRATRSRRAPRRPRPSRRAPPGCRPRGRRAPYSFSTSARPSRSWRSSIADRLQDVDRLEAGDDDRPAVLLATKPYGRVPMTVETWPGPTKPSIAVSGESRIARSAGPIRTWLQKTEKFRTPLLPRAQQRQRGRRRGRLEADGEEDDLALGLAPRELERVERRVDDAHVGAARLRLEQRAAPPARHAEHVAEGREGHRRAARRARSRRRRGPSGSRRPGSRGRARTRPRRAGARRARAGRSRACARRRPPSASRGGPARRALAAPRRSARAGAAVAELVDEPHHGAATPSVPRARRRSPRRAGRASRGPPPRRSARARSRRG